MAIPTNTFLVLDTTGSLLTLTFSEPVVGVLVAEYLFEGGPNSLANAMSVGDGSVWTMDVSPAVAGRVGIALGYFGSSTKNLGGTSVANFTHTITSQSVVGVSNGKSLLAFWRRR